MMGDRKQKTGVLVSDLRARHRGRLEIASNHADPAAWLVKAFDFADLPEMETYRLMEAAADRLDFASPYFRVHDGPPGASHVISGAPRLNFASYDYLGLNGDPRIRDAVVGAIDRWGISPSASRVVGGERQCHRDLERALAEMHGVEDAVVMVSGHATNVTTVSTLLGPEDLIITDMLAHNSIIEGANLSGAKRLTFPHNDYDWLEDELARSRHRHRHVLIAVEGLYSMDGDSPNLGRLIEIKARHNAWLMVDEAHSIGVLGPTGRGIAEAQSIDPGAVEIWMGTLSKALGACGGYIAGSASLVQYLKYRAPGFVYSVGLPPPIAVAAEMGLRLMLEEPERVERLQTNGRYFLDRCRAEAIDPGLSQGHAVTAIQTGDSVSAVALSHALFQEGINALPVVYPAVPERSARVRFFITARHSEEDLTSVAQVMSRCCAEVESARPQAMLALGQMASEMGVQSSGRISARNP